jgi:hypothetical protein
VTVFRSFPLAPQGLSTYLGQTRPPGSRANSSTRPRSPLSQASAKPSTTAPRAHHQTSELDTFGHSAGVPSDTLRQEQAVPLARHGSPPSRERASPAGACYWRKRAPVAPCTLVGKVDARRAAHVRISRQRRARGRIARVCAEARSVVELDVAPKDVCRSGLSILVDHRDHLSHHLTGVSAFVMFEAKASPIGINGVLTFHRPFTAERPYR